MSSTARLSPWRVTLAVIIVLATAVAGVLGVRMYEARAAQEPASHWFAGYVDVTATPSYAFEEGSVDAEGHVSDVVLSFIVADEAGSCTPSWGTYYGLEEAGAELDLDRRIQRLREQGAGVVVSFGGAMNQELATVCESPEELAEAYLAVIERYDLDTIDLDIEGPALEDPESNALRAEAVALLQKKLAAAGKPLAVWLTLPVIPSGLTADGRDVVIGMLDSGADLAGVNLMTMNYGQARDSRSMFDASAASLHATHRQLGIMYEQAGIPLSSASLWGKLGATPMVGQNDVVDEVFTVDDAQRFNEFAVENGVGRMSMWSLNRDATCGPNYPDTSRVSDACSGVDQGELRFAEVLSQSYTGHAAEAASATTTPDPAAAAPAEDDPETSPYPIWTEEASYLEGTKIVWHRNVYEAKWWTRGELPDNPVLEAWDTPWELIGPVLPGETPLPVFTVEKGTYPAWKGSTSYDKGDRVLAEGTPYEAKWWTEGDSPDASQGDPDSSPWVPLTAEDVTEDAAEDSEDSEDSEDAEDAE
ncbi:glycosyl hydrolase family 18 [Nesterenkonia sp. AN1]|uniref:Chitinase (Glycosyl hydrolase family 18) n=1 Tax=Nesterenkonia aurantiaca TaxID=1436010 RepID=A0A4R7FZ86_9MICC|nr:MULTISPECIES: carbohydrate-binding protein [Nesterenkonia]EXF25830.1 glycosyl hydrolase family 18 [Nesterenkonia sp. AN1]TDS84213.1 chitinase (glycosyl hydrolase family 18) [Nesterenkonia aurantiaca]